MGLGVWQGALMCIHALILVYAWSMWVGLLGFLRLVLVSIVTYIGVALSQFSSDCSWYSRNLPTAAATAKTLLPLVGQIDIRHVRSHSRR